MHTFTDSLSRARSYELTEKVWFNAVWFQTIWFLCVIGREPLLPAAIAMVALHLMLVRSAKDEIRRIAPVVALGVMVDSLLSAIGVFDFGGTLIPLWLCIIWIAFAASIPRAFAVFGKRLMIAAVIGGLGVPFNYAVGAQLGAVDFPLGPVITGLILVSVWAVLLPGLYRLSLSRYAEASTCPRL